VHDILARQMIGQWLAERLGGVAGADDGRRCLGDRFDLGVFETQPELVRFASQALRSSTELHAAKLGNLHPELLELGISDDQHRLQKAYIVGQRGGIERHVRA
jgi:hypothetical protein